MIRQDFNDCIQPIKASKFEVPEGNFVFPLKDRCEKVRLGGATDALERPVSESFGNQDAEEASPVPNGSGDQLESEPLVVDPRTGKMMVPNDAGGTLGRRYGGGRGSRKPDHIPSYLWTAMSKSKQQKDQAIGEAARDAALGALEAEHSDKSKPSTAAFFSRDFWEIWGDKVIRYHCIP